jgi:hypothetical protein
MRSLKIIIFRDTDKPYTMILSSGLLIGLSFGLIALLSLFTFSVLSNVMLYSGEPGSGGPQQAAITPAETPTQQNEQGEDIGEQQGNAAEQGGEDDQQAADTGEEQTGDEQQSGDEQTADTGEGEAEIPVETIEETAGEPSSGLQPFNPATAATEVVLERGPTLSSREITFTAQVRKRREEGIRVQGRFVAALVDRSGEFGPVYPGGINIEDGRVMNPQRGNSFSIAHRRNIAVSFNDIDPTDYAQLVLMIFDDDTGELQWRSIVPLPRGQSN